MRCSSCEPLLDSFLEGTLPRRRALAIARHLSACDECSALLRELRVIDALLETASPPRAAVAGDFTASVLSAARRTRPHAPRRVPYVVPLVLYLAGAWTLVAVAALRSNSLLAIGAAFLAAEERNAAGLGVALRALAPATPVAAAAVTLVLLLDVFLLGALLYGYRRVRPLLALYFERGERS
jgi:anti-sigma factor RsiW